jgi:EpsI family protein
MAARMNSDIKAHTDKGKLSIALVILLVFSFVFAYSEIITWVIKSWFTFQNSYSLLIFAISVYMIWVKRGYLFHLVPKSSIIAGSSLTIIACLVAVSAKLSSTLMLQGVSLVITLLGLIWLVLGSEYLKRLIVPVGYLILMFSLFEELLGNVSIYLQQITAWIATGLLELYGMPVNLTGIFIKLPHITLEVAKVCSGVNHIIALVALAIPLTIILQTTPIKKMLIVPAVFIIGIFANGLRVALIGIWIRYHGTGSIHGPFELLYVSFIFLFGMGLIILMSLISRKFINEKGASIQLSSEAEPGFNFSFNQLQPLPLIISLIILSTAAFLMHFYKPTPVYLAKPLVSFPGEIGQWHGKDINDRDWPFKNHVADEKLKRIYRDTDGSDYNIGLYIAYYSSQNQEREIINDRLNWLYNRADDQFIQAGSKTLPIKKGLPRGLPDQTYQGDQRSFYFWYEIDRKILTGRYKTKLVTLLNSFFKRRSNGAMIVVTIDDKWNQNKETNQLAVKFIETAFPYIQEALKTAPQ